MTGSLCGRNPRLYSRKGGLVRISFFQGREPEPKKPYLPVIQRLTKKGLSAGPDDPFIVSPMVECPGFVRVIKPVYRTLTVRVLNLICSSTRFRCTSRTRVSRVRTISSGSDVSDSKVLSRDTDFIPSRSSTSLSSIPRARAWRATSPDHTVRSVTGYRTGQDHRSF